MKKTISIAMLTLVAIVGTSTAMAGGNGGGGGGTNLRFAPFSGDVSQATEREKQSFYYEIAKRQADRKSAEVTKSE